MIKEKLNLPPASGFSGEPAPDPALFKVLGHPRRLAILKRLMATRATLTQLGEYFQQTPAHIRHHLQRLEQAGLVEMVEARPVQGGPEKVYQAARGALFIHQAVLPELPPEKAGLIIGSMDAGIRRLAGFFAQRRAPFSLLPVPLSSLDGLIALRQGLCQLSACHLVDPPSGEYNRPFVRRLFPCQSMALILVYRREEGLLVKPGNPVGVRTLEDLARPGLRFINREPGSGVRQWLDLRLDRLGIPAGAIPSYTRLAYSHAEVARAIGEGTADTGLGIAAAAREHGLDFLPLFDEPYEIAAPLSFVSDPRYSPFFDALHSGEVRAALRGLDGYTIPHNAGAMEVIG